MPNQNSNKDSPVKKAIVAGHICLDIIPSLGNVPPGRFFDLFQPGLMLQIGPPVLSTGGPVSNTGLALHLLGIPVELMGKVGRDLFGQAILDLLQQKGKELPSRMIVDPKASTSYTIIISPPGIDRMFLHHPGANDTYGVEDIPFHELQKAALFHFGYPPVMLRMYSHEGQELSEVFYRAKKAGVTTSLDMCFPDPESAGGKVDWRRIYKKTLPHVDIFSPSIEELLFTLRQDLYMELYNRAGSRFLDLVTPDLLTDISNELMDMGVKIVLLKLGERGAYLRTAEADSFASFGAAMPDKVGAWAGHEILTPCFSVNVVGTTGAGDATIAGFLCSLLRNGTPEEAITAAVAVGACNVEAADAISGIRSWEETQDRIAMGWAKQFFPIHSPRWDWDSQYQLWVGPAKRSR